MTVLLPLILTIALVSTVALMLRFHREQARAWCEERRELLTRIQHPEHVPVVPVPFDAPDAQDDHLALVGTISYDGDE